MQTVAAYLLERRDGLEVPEARAVEAERLQESVTAWLKYKGAALIARSGTFAPEDGSTGTYSIDSAVDGPSSWWMLRLDEDTREGRRFSTAVSVTAALAGVFVYTTLETGWSTRRIMPVQVDSKCPRIVRELLAIPGNWYHGWSTLRSLHRVNGFDEGEGLAAEISHPSRTVPLVVVSEREGAATLPFLDEKLAYDLAGLANVAVVDDEASWALTDILGSAFCCYWGAVRLYWPHFSRSQDPFFHPLWTRERLQSLGNDPTEARERFRRRVRSILFRASALSVTRPREIDGIRDAASQRALKELRQRATSLEEYEQLADSYSIENDQLRDERTALRTQVEDLQAQVVRLTNDREALLAHLNAAGDSVVDVGEEASVEDTDAPAGAPVPNEVRFYKKVHSRQAYDVMQPVADCGCNNWQSAHAADKAKKGISKLEDGKIGWKTIQHCASCTGGGMWRVRW